MFRVEKDIKADFRETVWQRYLQELPQWDGFELDGVRHDFWWIDAQGAAERVRMWAELPDIEEDPQTTTEWFYAGRNFTSSTRRCRSNQSPGHPVPVG